MLQKEIYNNLFNKKANVSIVNESKYRYEDDLLFDKKDTKKYIEQVIKNWVESPYFESFKYGYHVNYNSLINKKIKYDLTDLIGEFFLEKFGWKEQYYILDVLKDWDIYDYLPYLKKYCNVYEGTVEDLSKTQMFTVDNTVYVYVKKPKKIEDVLNYNAFNAITISDDDKRIENWKQL